MVEKRIHSVDALRLLAKRSHAAVSLVAVACFLALASVSLVATMPSKAHAAVSYSYPSAGETGVSTSGTFYFYFQNNVAADDVFGANAGLVYLVDEFGVSAGFSVYRLFSGNTPQDCPAGVDPEQRHFIYLDVGGLSPGTTYTMGVMPGVATQGGGVEGGYALTFTTAGEAPLPPEPEPEPEPEPTPDPPAVPGGGGSGGMGGSAALGGGADQGGSNDAGTAAGLAVATSPEASLKPEAAPQSAATSATQSGESRAAGTGGGTVYAVGSAGLTPGNVVEKVPVETPVFSWWFAFILCVVGVGAALVGAVKRAVVWRRHSAR